MEDFNTTNTIRDMEWIGFTGLQTEFLAAMILNKGFKIGDLIEETHNPSDSGEKNDYVTTRFMVCIEGQDDKVFEVADFANEDEAFEAAKRYAIFA